MTQKEMYERIATINKDDAEIVDFCNHKIEQLANRSTSKSPTKTQKENVVLMGVIETALAQFDAPTTVTELLATTPIKEYAEANNVIVSNQKISALLRKMVNDEKTVKKTIEGKKALFSLV